MFVLFKIYYTDIMNIKTSLGNRIKEIRKNQNLTQEMLAERANISNQSMSLIENGYNFVSAETTESLCKALNVTPKELFDFGETISENDSIEEIVRRLKRNPTLLKTIYKIVIALDI